MNDFMKTLTNNDVEIRKLLLKNGYSEEECSVLNYCPFFFSDQLVDMIKARLPYKEIHERILYEACAFSPWAIDDKEDDVDY